MHRHALIGIWLVAILTAAPFGHVVATVVDGLYEARVPVSDKGAAERNQALAAALAQVIVKITGERDPGSNPIIADGVAQASRYVQQFRYVASEQASSAAGLELWTRFDAREVDALVRSAELPLWGRERPSIVAWVAIERGNDRELLGADDTSGLVEIMRSNAGTRGLPIVLPLLDLEDRERVRVSDVWGGFSENITTASARYESGATLVGRAYRVLPSLWEARWTLLLSDGAQEWTGNADSLSLLLGDGVQSASDLLASRYASAPAADGASHVRLVVEGVGDLRDYARVLRYLETLDQVDAVNVTEVAQNRVSFAVDARGGSRRLRQVIGLGRTLSTDTEATLPGELRYRLVP